MDNVERFVPLVEQGLIVLDLQRGMVWRRRGDRLVKVGGRSSKGYIRVRATIDGRSLSTGAHRLLLRMRHGRPLGSKVTNHIDGNRANNAAENLELVTPAENTRHARDALGEFHGERNGNARLRRGDVLAICRRLRAGEKRDALAARFGVTPEAIRLIGHGRRWRKLLQEAGELQEAA